MRKLNLRWLVGLVIGPIVLAGLGFLLHEFQMGRNASVFLREARRAQAEDRPEEAADHLRRYVKLAPKDAEGLILFGLQLADLNRVQPAYLTLERAIRQLPDRTDVRRRLVELAIKLGRFSDAMDHLTNRLLKESPQDGELLEQLSTCQFAKGEIEKAAETLESAIASAPKRLDAYVKLASLRRDKLNRPEDAIDPIDQMVSNNSENHRAFLLRGQWLMRQLIELKASHKVGRTTGERDAEKLRSDADADAKQALKLAPDDDESLLFAARIAQEAGRIDEAREIAQHGIDVHPSDSHFYSVLAELGRATTSPTASVEMLQRGALADPKDLDLKWNLANSLIDLERFDEAKDVIAQLRAAGHPESLDDYLDARLLMRRSEWLAAIMLLEKIRPGLRDWPALVKQADFSLGLAYRETNSPDQQLVCFRRAAALDPDWIPASMAVAESLASSNHIQEAVKEYKQILSRPGAPTAAVLGLAKSLLLLNLRIPPNQQNWDEFDAVMKIIEQTDLPPTQIAILKTEKQLAKENQEEAAQTVAEAREKNPNQSELWTAQISLAQQSRDWDRVEQLLQDAEKQLGDSVSLRLMKGRYLAQRHGAESSVQLQQLAEPASSWTEQQRIQLASGLAPLFLSIGDFDEATKLATMIGRLEPNNTRIRLLLLDISLRAKRPELMVQTLEEIRIITGKGPIWHYGEAIRLSQLGQESKDPKSKFFGEALSHLNDARIARPTWERVPLLSADIYERQGELTAATEQYLEAIQLGERSPAVFARAVSLLLNAKKTEEADKLIRRLRESQILLTDEMARVEVDLSLRLGRKDQALKLTEQLVRDSPQAQDPLWLGQSYGTVEKYDLAEEQFRLAIKAKSDDPRAWVGLVKVLALSKQREKAELAIDEAKSTIPAELAMLVAGQCYELLGNIELARSSYRTAMEQSPENVNIGRVWIEFLMKTGAAADAEIALRKIVKTSTGTDEIERNRRQWAQRMLSVALMARGGRDQLKEAMAIVDRNLEASGTKSAEDLRMKANILARWPTVAERQQAIGILERLVAQDPVSAMQLEDRFLLAKLYLMVGEQTKSRNELRKLIADRKDDPRFLNAYVKLSLEAKETSEAELYLEPLQKLTPDDLSTADLQVQLLFARSKYSEIFNLLKKIGTRSLRENEKPEFTASLKYWAAKKFDEFALSFSQLKKTEEAARFAIEAESFYTQFVQERPQDMLVFADYLARTSQLDRALDLLQAHGPGSLAGRVAGVAVSVMKNTQATSSHLIRLQELLKDNMESHDQSLALALTLADLLSWIGDSQAASSLYKDIIRRDYRNIAALNNFAYLLSVTGGNHTEAMRLVQQAIEYGGPMDVLLDTRGLVQLAAGHPEMALQDFEQAVNEKESAERRFHIAIAYARQKQFKAAQQSLARAEELGLLDQDVHPLERTTRNDLVAQLKALGPLK